MLAKPTLWRAMFVAHGFCKDDKERKAALVRGSRSKLACICAVLILLFRGMLSIFSLPDMPKKLPGLPRRIPSCRRGQMQARWRDQAALPPQCQHCAGGSQYGGPCTGQQNFNGANQAVSHSAVLRRAILDPSLDKFYCSRDSLESLRWDIFGDSVHWCSC